MNGRGIQAARLEIDWPELMRFKRTFTEPVPKRRDGERHIRGDPGRTAEPSIEHFPGQPVLGTRISRFYGEFVQPLRLVFHVLAAPNTPPPAINVADSQQLAKERLNQLGGAAKERGAEGAKLLQNVRLASSPKVLCSIPVSYEGSSVESDRSE